MGEKVLIADADKAFRTLLEAELSECDDLDVAATGDYETARTALDRGEISILIADLMLHGGNGWRLLLDRLQRQPSLTVFATSKNIDLRLGRVLLSRGVREVIYKPIEPELLRKKLRFAMRLRFQTSGLEPESHEATDVGDVTPSTAG